MGNSYRIKANVGSDQVINVNLKQNIDLYEILSLSLRQENLYKLHSADYGVVVGRVLANDAFGVPNAKVSVFIPLSEEDSLNMDLRSLYPYKSVNDLNKDNIKYNTLPNYKKFDCHQAVGTLPKKQLVLDNDSMLEVFDKYYKYTTVTNKSGDYMLFGIPVGERILHIDVDLSDIGILSQKPRDFIYKGYTIDMFESPTQFKKSTNLDNLPQIHNESSTVTVYPFWGDKDYNEIAISRKDINLQYKFESTCVFLGSAVADSSSNSISHNCIPDENMGEVGQLSTDTGTIEMIRKTLDDKVEEYSIKGNQLIDSDGTWCYQIPMNLDYVGMDELGNIVPTNNPEKGIATRARVRFRITLDETGGNSLTTHKGRYLVPNNPDLYEGRIWPSVKKEIIDNDSFYEFGTLTPDECFRDLYWNKVYSVKSYIPRVQMSMHEKTPHYLAIKGVNKRNAVKHNPFPYNKANLNISVPAYYIFKNTFDNSSTISDFWRFLKADGIPFTIDSALESIAEEMDAVGLDFYNDWINGCLYFPSWYWYVRQKKKYKNGESVYDSQFCECKKTDKNGLKMYLYNSCSLVYDNDDLVLRRIDDGFENVYKMFTNLYPSSNFGSKNFYSGIIKKKTNKDGADIFYYSFGNKINDITISGVTTYDEKLPEDIRPDADTQYYRYARLFSTDIILLGSISDNDINGIPKMSYDIPSTTSNIPPMGRFKQEKNYNIDDSPEYESEVLEENILPYNGMNWGSEWYRRTIFPTGQIYGNVPRKPDEIGMLQYKYTLGTGLFFGLTAYGAMSSNRHKFFKSFFDYIFSKKFDKYDAQKIVPITDVKTCVNLERICELGVSLDSDVTIDYDISGETYSFISEMDGLITKREIENTDLRALFAFYYN